MASKNKFGAADYALFALSIVLCMAVGVFHAVRGKSHWSAESFFLGSRTMKVLPLTVSLVVSVISAVTLLGLPAEIYTQGTQYFFNIGSGLGIVLTAFIFVPLLYPLRLTSMFEYLERRFHSKAARMTGSVLEILALLLYGGTALFAPVTALQGVTVFPAWLLALVLGTIVTFYTALGGMRAVVWTDVLQGIVMVIGILAVVIQGVIAVGGVKEVFEINSAGNRLHFYNFDPDPTVRHTFWGLSVGFCLGGLSFYGASQFTFQRFTATNSLRDAKATVLLNLPAFYFFHIFLCFVGLVIYAYYAKQGCDPLQDGVIMSSNQLLPLFVMDTLGKIPGLPGLFVAALTSGALSTLSSVMNSVSALICEDILKRKLASLSNTHAMLITKTTVCLSGAAIIALTHVAANFGPHIFQVCFAFLGASGGPQLGMLLLGALVPWANWIGAISGCVAGLCVTCWVTVGAYITKPFTPPLPPAPSLGCDLGSNLSTTMAPSAVSTTVFNLTDQSLSRAGLTNLYSLSYTWYTGLGVLVCVLVGLLVSSLTGGDDPDSNLVLPWYGNVKDFCIRCCGKEKMTTTEKRAADSKDGAETEETKPEREEEKAMLSSAETTAV